MLYVTLSNVLHLDMTDHGATLSRINRSLVKDFYIEIGITFCAI